MSYQTKVKGISKEAAEFLDEFASLYSNIERRYYVDVFKNKETRGGLKKSYTKTYQITARHYNAIAINTDGKIKSKEELQKLYIEEVKEKIKIVSKTIEKKTDQKNKTFDRLNKVIDKYGINDVRTKKVLKKYKNLKFYIHQKKRKLRNLNHKLKRLTDKKNSICFGSKELFLKQYNLQENGYSSHSEWKKDWVSRRNAQFTFVGSKDESYGNVNCQYDLDNNMHIKVPEALVSKYGATVKIENVVFKYGQKEIDNAKLTYNGLTTGGKPKKYYNSAITYRFMKKNGDWYIIATVNVEEPKLVTSKFDGTIGVDLNAGFISVCEVDRHGNYLDSFDMPINMYNRTSEQVKASIGDAVKSLVAYAISKGKIICIEDLDFSKQKTKLTECGTKYSRMLSGLTYSTFKTMLISRAKRFGVEVKSINPAFTSVIGHFKFMKRYGLSSHRAAAMVIARRGLEFKRIERLSYNTEFETKALPINKTRRQQWSNLSYQSKKKYHFNDKIELLKICV